MEQLRGVLSAEELQKFEETFYSAADGYLFRVRNPPKEHKEK